MINETLEANRAYQRDKDDAYDRGYKQGKADAEPRWIPVTERLPEASGCYLVSVKNDHKRRYSKTDWFEKGTWFARQDVIAWMPLPEPYKEVTI